MSLFLGGVCRIDRSTMTPRACAVMMVGGCGRVGMRFVPPSLTLGVGVMRVPSPFLFADSPEFLRLLRGEEEPDLTRLAFEIARDAYPALNTSAYLSKIDGLAERVRDRCAPGAKTPHILGQINWVLYVEEGFRGNVDEYDDPRNSYLNQVIDRKLGIPISLSVVYLAIADRLGLAMNGVNLPGHFVIRVGQAESTIFVDPFHEGAMIDRAACARLAAQSLSRAIELSDSVLAPCSTGIIVLRMLRNLKAALIRDNHFGAAIPVLRRLVALDKENIQERRDLGIACVNVGMAGEALSHLSAYLTADPHAPDAEDIAALARVASREIARQN